MASIRPAWNWKYRVQTVICEERPEIPSSTEENIAYSGFHHLKKEPFGSRRKNIADRTSLKITSKLVPEYGQTEIFIQKIIVYDMLMP